MDRDTIIKLGLEADDHADSECGKGEFHPDWHTVRDEKFAALVKAEVLNGLHMPGENPLRDMAAAPAAQPDPLNEMRLTVVGQVHELCDQIERTLHTFGADDEARRQAQGAIDHARKVTAPYNYNGPLRMSAAPAEQPTGNEQQKADDVRCAGEDCPQGMVQVEFVGCHPSLKQGEYGWKPVKHAFMDVWVDGKRFHIAVGDFHDGVAQRRGLHVITSLSVGFEQTSLNAASLYLEAKTPVSGSNP